MVKPDLLSQRIFGNRKTFLRFQLTAATATAIDFLVTLALAEKFNIHYTNAVAIGAVSGAVTAFMVNRYWVFRSLASHPVAQGIRYLIIAAGSVLLNTAGTWLLTENTLLPYIASKAITALVIGFTYSYYFSKRFVFYA